MSIYNRRLGSGCCRTKEVARGHRQRQHSGLSRLSEADLLKVSEVREPSHELRAAVEAVCVCAGRVQTDFPSAQIRMMRPPLSLVRRLVNFDPKQIKPSCASLLSTFVSSPR
jgi:hypothetical protein